MKHSVVIGRYTLESLTNGLYASPLDLYREYIQNAVDSFDEVIQKDNAYANKLKIEISIDRNSNRVSIKDNGCGISEDKAIATLLDIGNSQKSRSNSRGFRGIGRLAGLGYCTKLFFRTSVKGENVSTVVEFNAELLNELLIPGESDSVSISDVIEKVVTIKKTQESNNKRYFEVVLEGLSDEDGLIDENIVRDYLVQHAPIPFDSSFQWQRMIIEKVRLEGYFIPQYRTFLNGVEIFKPYSDVFTSDRIKKNEDRILDINIKKFIRNGNISAILWYAQSNYFGTITDILMKGIRIRQGNILLGDRSSFAQFFKEERFNGWMIGELHVIDNELIANSRRDGFEKNKAFYELSDLLSEWALSESKEIRRISYKRSLSSEKMKIVEADSIEDVNDLCVEFLEKDEIHSDEMSLDQSESDDVAENDFIGKLSLFLNQKKFQTKYIALNINNKLTAEQRRSLERVFDIISQQYDQKVAEEFINKIASQF